jgi:alpha,alpha-trehalase
MTRARGAAGRAGGAAVGRAPGVAPPHALRDYAVIADGERGVLIGPQGHYAWMCFPSWESPAIFTGLLGGPGTYSVIPADDWHVWGGYYEPRSLIWRSRWVSGGMLVECRQALARPARRDRAVLLCRIEAKSGTARMRATLDLRADFGRKPMGRASAGADGVWSMRSGDVHARWAGAEHARHHAGEGLVLDLELAAGGFHDLVLELSTGEPSGPLDPVRLWEATESDWRGRVPPCDDTLAPRDAQLAYAVLTGLTSSAGGMVAAATTSLPERSKAGRNYDYRYAWIRDQCYAGQAAAAHGARPELLDTAVEFVAGRILADGDRIKPAYTVAGGPVPQQQRLPLPGYPGADVVTGNHVTDQFQLDAYGEALLLFASAARLDRLPADARQAASVAVDAIVKHRDEPEAGIWETENRLWTHSRLICVAGLRAAAAALGRPPESGDWLALADSMLADTTRSSLSRAGYWRRAPDDDRLDASLLIPPVRGALAAGDPRTVATLSAVSDQLVDDGFVYRYRIDERPLGYAEGAFMLCGFFLALAEQQQGRTAEALRCFERSRSGCGTSGLFTEEYDVAQRQLRANLPQAFVHAGLLETAARLATADPDATPLDHSPASELAAPAARAAPPAVQVGRPGVGRVARLELAGPPPAEPGPFQGAPGRGVGLLDGGDHRGRPGVPAERHRGEPRDRGGPVPVAGHRRVPDQVVDPGRAPGHRAGGLDGVIPGRVVGDQVPLDQPGRLPGHLDDEQFGRIGPLDARQVGDLDRGQIAGIPPPLGHVRLGQPPGQNGEIAPHQRAEGDCGRRHACSMTPPSREWRPIYSPNESVTESLSHGVVDRDSLVHARQFQHAPDHLLRRGQGQGPPQLLEYVLRADQLVDPDRGHEDELRQVDDQPRPQRKGLRLQHVPETSGPGRIPVAGHHGDHVRRPSRHRHAQQFSHVE